MTNERHDDPLATDESVTLVKKAYYDRETDDELVTVLATAIADALGADPLDTSRMPPLFYSLDPELLEKVLFEPTPVADGIDPDKTMIFDYDELTIAVRNDGWVFVYEPELRNS